MILVEREGWLYTVVVRQSPGTLLLTHRMQGNDLNKAEQCPSYSGLRPRSDDLVCFPTAPHQSPIAESHHPCSRLDRSDRFCFHQSVLLSEQYGDHGGNRPKEEARQCVLGSTEEKLDGVAGGASCEFQVCAVRAPSHGG